jgi:hypothetical protein
VPNGNGPTLDRMRVLASLLVIPYSLMAFLGGWASLYLMTGDSGQVEILGINYRLPWAPLVTVAFLLVAGTMAVVAMRLGAATRGRQPG